MTCETPTIRPLRRTDFPALEELIRLAWYDDGNDSHNTHDEVGQTSGPDKHRAELRKATRLRNMHRLAAIDMQDCLARTTKAYVAELNGQVLGVILGSLRSDITGRQRTRHMLRRHCLTLPLLASHEGRHGLLAQLAILQADEALKHDAGKEYEAEVVLFVVSRPHEAWEWGADCSTICLAYSMTPACANTSCSPTAHAMSASTTIED